MSIRKMTEAETKRLHDSLAHEKNLLFYCGDCNDSQNEWYSREMLFDIEQDIPVTPCCHNEATEALNCYCPEDRCEADDDSDERDERSDYRYAQTGRY